jgi:hypothetical protein
MIAQQVQADEDTVRDVIHRFNEIRVLTVTQSVAYVRRWFSAGGCQVTGPWSVLDRLLAAETAIRARGSSRSLA